MNETWSLLRRKRSRRHTKRMFMLVNALSATFAMKRPNWREGPSFSPPTARRIAACCGVSVVGTPSTKSRSRSEEHTSELQSLRHLVCRLLLEKKKTIEQY